MEHKKELKQFKRKENQLVKELLTINENNIRTFKGNPLLKKADEKVEMTRAHVREFKKCMNDPVYFAERYIKIVHVDKGLIPIELYDYQKRILKALKEHRFNILLSCRQSGKCCSLNTIVKFKHPHYNNNIPFEMTIGAFYEWQRLRRLGKALGPKFIDSIELESGWAIETDTGFEPISHIHKTVPYEKWILKTDSFTLECADNHIVFRENFEEIFVKDLSVGDLIVTSNGLERVVSLENTHIEENMYDITVAHKNHRYYTDGILSHNTTLVVCFLVWYVIFHADKACAVLANKGSTARQIVGRIELAYQNLPKFLQQGVVAWNMGSFSLENGSSICSASTTSDSVRGSSFSCVAEDTLVTIVDDDDNVWNIPINKVDQMQKAGSMKQYHREKKYYYVYRIINKINNKEYIGFHSTNNMNDGYMGSGKLIIKAIEKYGIENFEKEILKQFNNKKDAELYERELVNEEYVKRNDTYNISIGGNVCILCGEQNGFYGKKHKPETIAKIVKANKERYSRGEMRHPETLKTTPMRIGNHIFDSYNHAKKVLGLTPMNINYYLYADENCYMLNEEDQQKACQIYKEYAKNKIIRHQKHVENMRKANQRPERNAKLSASLVGKKHPWNIKINTNPEKIAKTAAKHRGMKRSAETCRKISEALKAKNRKQAENKTHESIN